IHGCFQFWSLCVEEHFYLLWPIAVWVLGRRPLMRFCVAGAAGSFLLRVLLVAVKGWGDAAFMITPCRLDGLLAGAFVALAWRNPTDWERLRRAAGRVVPATGCLLLGIAIGQRHFLPDPDVCAAAGAMSANLVLTVGIAALAVFFAGLIVLCVGGDG